MDFNAFWTVPSYSQVPLATISSLSLAQCNFYLQSASTALMPRKLGPSPINYEVHFIAPAYERLADHAERTREGKARGTRNMGKQCSPTECARTACLQSGYSNCALPSDRGGSRLRGDIGVIRMVFASLPEANHHLNCR